jgi:hypothetical protein
MKLVQALPLDAQMTVILYLLHHNFTGYREVAAKLSTLHGIKISKSALWEFSVKLRREHGSKMGDALRGLIAREAEIEAPALARLSRRLKAIAAGFDARPDVLEKIAASLLREPIMPVIEWFGGTER